MKTADQFSPEEWAERWSNFSLQEMSCRCCGQAKVREDLMDMLQATRTELGEPMVVTSGYRCPSRNHDVSKSKGMVTTGRHPRGEAVDVRTPDSGYRARLHAAARNNGFKSFAITPGGLALHMDLAPRDWLGLE